MYSYRQGEPLKRAQDRGKLTMTLLNLWPYLVYLLYLVWLVQSARLLAMLATGNWDGVPSVRVRVIGFLRRRIRLRRNK